MRSTILSNSPAHWAWAGQEGMSNSVVLSCWLGLNHDIGCISLLHQETACPPLQPKHAYNVSSFVLP